MNNHVDLINCEAIEDLLEDFIDEFDEAQHYNPLYQSFLPATEKETETETETWNMNLNTPYSIKEIKKEGDSYKIYLKHHTSRDFFVKYAPLVDPVRFMEGKVKRCFLPHQSEYQEGISNYEKNHVAYVDGFFSYLSTLLLSKYGMVNGLEFYGQFPSVKKNFVFSLEEDLDYLMENNFFNDHKDDYNLAEVFYKRIERQYSKKNKRRLNLSDFDGGDDVEDLGIENIEDYEKELGYHEIFKKSHPNNFSKVDYEVVYTDISAGLGVDGADADARGDGDGDGDFDADARVVIGVNDIVNDHNSEHSSSSSATCSSRSSDTESEGEGESDGGSEGGSQFGSESGSFETISESGSGSGSGSARDSFTTCDNEITATLKSFPVNMILLEKCQNTLDNHMEETHISNEEWKSILFQITMTLCAYQKAFCFVHNDLHTSNIMYVNTDREFLTYYFEGNAYRIPTYGRIWKIIDFGRAVYRYRDQVFFSDSFAPKGDAATQYNCEPYLNPNKKVVLPNMSFDLCRLACSIYDDFFEDEDYTAVPSEKLGAVESLIFDWCLDYKGRNVLMKNNGEERYPGFKLYKMISRQVHGNVPKEQLNKPMFSQFRVDVSRMEKLEVDVNIDSIPRLYVSGVGEDSPSGSRPSSTSSSGSK